MYRYNPLKPRKGRMDEQRPRFLEKVKTVVIVLLLVALIGGAVIAVPAIRFRSNTNDLLVRRMASECGEAVTLAGTLSRTAGTSSYDTLARVRSRVYAMELMNSLSVNLNGSSGTIVSSEWFTNLTSQLDNYGTQLITGMSTGDLATTLQMDLNTLYAQLQTLY